MHALTPPYHFSIVACPPCLPCDDADTAPEILYRGSQPAVRNFPFLKRLGLRTIVCLQKKPLGGDEALVRWAAKHKVELVWIKAEKMTEESLGMGRTQVGDALKVILDPSAYPLYIADKDGISHTTLLVSCLRKLQGWTPDSILDEITRFEPDHEDLPLVPFVTSYLSTGPSTDALILPSLPLPSWLWPTTTQTASGTVEKSINSPVSATMPGVPHSRSGTSLSSQTRDREPSVSKERDKDREKETSKEREKDRERIPSAPANTGPLPFPHPLHTRKHPTMKLTFPVAPSSAAAMPPPPTPSAPLGLRHMSISASPDVVASPTTISAPGSIAALSRVNSRRERSTTATTTREDDQSLMAAATSILAAALVAVGVGGEDEPGRAGAAGREGKNSVAPRQAGLGNLGSRRGSIVSGTEQMSRTVSRERGPTFGAGQGGSPMLQGSDQGSVAKDGEGDVSPNARSGRDEVLGGHTKAGDENRDQGEETELGIGNGFQKGETGGVEIDPEGTEAAYAEDEDDEEDDEDDDDDDDEDEDDDDEVDLQPTSLHISALDLAGYS